MNQSSLSDLLIGKTFFILSRKIFIAISAVIEDPELKRYFYGILILEDPSEPITQTDFALALGTDKTNAVRIIDLLVDAKFIVRKECKLDRRRHHLELTKKGAKKAVDIKKAAEGIYQQALKGFTKKEKDLFSKHLIKISSNLAEIEAGI